MLPSYAKKRQHLNRNSSHEGRPSGKPKHAAEHALPRMGRHKGDMGRTQDPASIARPMPTSERSGPTQHAGFALLQTTDDNQEVDLTIAQLKQKILALPIPGAQHKGVKAYGPKEKKAQWDAKRVAPNPKPTSQTHKITHSGHSTQMLGMTSGSNSNPASTSRSNTAVA